MRRAAGGQTSIANSTTRIADGTLRQRRAPRCRRCDYKTVGRPRDTRPTKKPDQLVERDRQIANPLSGRVMHGVASAAATPVMPISPMPRAPSTLNHPRVRERYPLDWRDPNCAPARRCAGRHRPRTRLRARIITQDFSRTGSPSSRGCRRIADASLFNAVSDRSHSTPRCRRARQQQRESGILASAGGSPR